MMNSENFGEVLYLGDEFEYGSYPYMVGGSGGQGGCGGSGGYDRGKGSAVTSQVSSDNEC